MRKIFPFASFALLSLVFASCGPDNSQWLEDPANDTMVCLTGALDQIDDALEMCVSIPDVSDIAHQDLVYRFPVKNGKFEALVPLNREGIYHLNVVHKQGYTQALFLADADTVRFRIGWDFGAPRVLNEDGANGEYRQYKMSSNAHFEAENQALRAEYDAIENSRTEEFYRMHSLWGETQDQVLKDSLATVLAQMEDDGSGYSPEYQAYQEHARQLTCAKLDYARDYLKERRPSLATFLILYESIVSADRIESRFAEWMGIYDREYSNKFPNCNLHHSVETRRSAHQLYEGMSVVDFSLPDADGQRLSLASLVDGKPAVLQFWATWCGSCCTKREWLQPIYDRYKDRGFTVVEVAREYRNDKAWRKYLQEHPADWTELLALGEDQVVGELYGVGQAVGALFLVDAQGTVIKIDPSAAEIEAFLKDYYQ